MTKRIVLMLLALIGLSIGVSACHTAHGFGEDMSTAGEKIQNNTSP